MRLFVNVASKGTVAVADVGKTSVTATWPLKDAAANFPMAIDEAERRLFVGTRSPARVLVLDTDTGAIIANLDSESDADDLFYDSERHQLYAICGGGSIVVYRRKGDKYEAPARIATAAGARTGLYVQALGRLFVAVPRRGSQPAEIRVFDVGR